MQIPWHHSVGISKDFQIDGHVSFQFGCIGIVFSKYDFFIENGGKHVLLLYCLILDRNEKKEKK